MSVPCQQRLYLSRGSSPEALHLRPAAKSALIRFSEDSVSVISTHLKKMFTEQPRDDNERETTTDLLTDKPLLTRMSVVTDEN